MFFKEKFLTNRTIRIKLGLQVKKSSHSHTNAIRSLTSVQFKNNCVTTYLNSLRSRMVNKINKQYVDILIKTLILKKYI